MNRRTFLRSIATVCGAAVVCPGELLKGEPKPVKVPCKHEFRWFAAKNEDAPAHCTVFNYDRYYHYKYTCTLCGFTKYVEFRRIPGRTAQFPTRDHPVFIKARQQGMNVIIYDEFATQRDKMYFAFRGAYY
jgi:hypothetical protein